MVKEGGAAKVTAEMAEHKLCLIRSATKRKFTSERLTTNQRGILGKPTRTNVNNNKEVEFKFDSYTSLL